MTFIIDAGIPNEIYILEGKSALAKDYFFFKSQNWAS